MSGFWTFTWSLSDDRFEILDPYCAGSKNTETPVTIEAHQVLKYIITVRANRGVSEYNIRNLKFGFLYFDATKNNGKEEFDKFYFSRSEKAYDDLVTELRRIGESKNMNEYQAWHSEIKLKANAREAAWMCTHQLARGYNCGMIWED